MGKVCITHQTALRYWLGTFGGAPEQRRLSRMGYLPEEVVHDGEVRSAVESIPELRGIGEDIHCIVSSDRSRCAVPGVVPHVCARPLPGGAFVKLCDDVLIASPELCFVQVAQGLGRLEPEVLAYYLCGAYRLDPFGFDGISSREPLTSVKKLKNFVERASGLRGTKAARMALTYVLDGSASPRETRLGMRLALPRRRGGFGFDVDSLELNHPVEVPEELRALTGCDRYFIDLFHVKARYGLEYDGRASHFGREERDALRDIVLERVGIGETRLTKRQLESDPQMVEVAKLFAQKTGTRLPKLDNEFAWRQYDLHDDLEAAFSAVERRIRTACGWD